MRRKLRLGAAVLVSACALAAGTASPAAAQWERCPSLKFCVFEHANGQGKYAYFDHLWYDFARPIGGFVFNDKISSVYNRATAWSFCVYEHRDFGGGARIFGPYSGVAEPHRILGQPHQLRPAQLRTMLRLAAVHGARRRILVALAIACCALAATSTPASASYEQCPDGAFCVWTNPGGDGYFAYFYSGSRNLTWPIGGVVFNDRITTVWNRTGKRWCVWKDIDYKGPVHGVGHDVKGLPYNFWYQVSSLRGYGC